VALNWENQFILFLSSTNFRQPISASVVFDQSTPMRWHLPFTSLSLSRSFSRPFPLPTPLSSVDIETLEKEQFLVVKNFLPPSLLLSLRSDHRFLRSSDRFVPSGIGDDKTLATSIRNGESLFLSRNLSGGDEDCRSSLHSSVDEIADCLNDHMGEGEIINLATTELLYAYYPRGGFYSKHVDSLPNSVSAMRCWSFLIYLNENWKKGDGGELRVHHSGLPPLRCFDEDIVVTSDSGQYFDVQPVGGALVIFKSSTCLHEVLPTLSDERIAVVGWFNRKVSSTDIFNLISKETATRIALGSLSVVMIVLGLRLLLES